MLGMVEIPTKVGASALYSCLPAGREGRVKALPFLTGLPLIYSIGLLKQIGHFITIEQKFGTFL